MRALSICISSFLFISAVLISGCSDSVSNSTGIAPAGYQARTERDFETYGELKAEAGAVVYTELEHLNTPSGLLTFDTGTPGEDIIPYHYTDTLHQTVRLNSTANLKARLISDVSNMEIYNLTPVTNTVTVTIPAGNYKLYLTSLINYGSDTLGKQDVFIQNDTNLTDAGSLSTFIATQTCDRCNLDGADLSGLKMNNIQLTFSSLVNANFSNGTFKGIIANCNLTGANLSNANFSYSVMGQNNFTNAVLVSTNLARANLSNLNFTRANLQYANLRNSIIVKATFSNADLSHADLSYAQIINSNFCGAIKTGLISTGVLAGNNQCWP